MDEIKRQLVELMKRDAENNGIALDLDINPTDKDPGKVKINGELARICQKFSGILFQVDPTWFSGGLDKPIVNREPFDFYLLPLISDNRTVAAYHLCDYMRMRDMVLDIQPALTNRYRGQGRWRGVLKLVAPNEGYLRWGGESPQFLSPRRKLEMNNLGQYFLGDEEHFQDIIQGVQAGALKPGPISVPPKSLTGIHRYQRSAERSAAALSNAAYLCEIDNAHRSFTSRRSGKMYVEAHHLIPIEFQNDFKYSLDVEENIISMCPTCHKRLHLGEFSDIKPLVLKLIVARESSLERRGIKISRDKILELYK